MPSAIYLLKKKSHSSHLKLALTEQFITNLLVYFIPTNKLTHVLLLYLNVCAQGPGQLNKIQHRFRRKSNVDGSISDVYDSKLYKMHSGPGGFLEDPYNISLLGNTDGVALIRSSGYGVWPVFLVINELPPLQR